MDSPVRTRGLGGLPRHKTSILGQCQTVGAAAFALPKQGFHLEAQRTKPFSQCGWGEPAHQYSFYPRYHFWKSLACIKPAWSTNGPESLSPTHQFKVGIHIQTWAKHVSQALKGSFIKGYSSSDWREIEKERDGQDKGGMDRTKEKWRAITAWNLPV